MHYRISFLSVAVVCFCAGCVNLHPGSKREVSLTENGRTEYVIVQPEAPTAIDTLAIKELSAFLKQATGAQFEVAPPDKAKASRKRIFVGLSAPALKVLGKDPLAGMQDQEHVARNIGADIFLYGQGPHGNLYAVYDFLETSVGCRWYSAFGGMKIPQHPSLRLAAFNRRTCPAFAYRYACVWAYGRRPDIPFFCRNRVNEGVKGGAGASEGYTGIVDKVDLIPPGVHTLFAYVPPQPTRRPGAQPPLEFLKNKDYFKTNPEFFSMDASSNRTDSMQLCFSSKELRHTFTENVVEHVKLCGGKGVISVSANDIPGHFCNCPECLKLEKQYAGIGGPIYDYLLELCAVLKTNYPDVFVSTLAYRKEQTQKPPKIDKLPDNLIVIFAPIDDNFGADWNHPSNIETYRDLEQWCRLAKNVWPWYYVNTYGGPMPPWGNIERLVNDIRLMSKAGCNGTFFQHDVGVSDGSGFSELQTYLMLKLFQDPNQDADVLVSEFMEFQYGKAAALMHQYLDDLEKCRKEMDTPIGWCPLFSHFRYLTPDNLFHWEKSFDRMEQLTTDAPASRFNVQMVRYNLDMAVLRKWLQVKQSYPDYFKDIKSVETRIRAAYDKVGKERGYWWPRQNFEHEMNNMLILAANPGKPLPEQFLGIAADRIRRVPTPGTWIKDSEAAFGLAAEAVSERPFKFGFYDANNKKFVLERTIELSEIKPDAYQFYKLGTVELTPSCVIWLASWRITADVSEFYRPGVRQKWDVYVSMKFEGPSYSKNTQLKEDRVRSDQVVLVETAP